MKDVIRFIIGRGNHEVLIDARDASILADYRCTTELKGRVRYVRCALRGRGKDPRYTFLHVLIMQPPPGMEVDHINGNGLDNRRANLRHVSHQQNTWNRGASISGPSPFKGVCKYNDGRGRPWMARIGHPSTHLGAYATAEEAARAYDEAAKSMHGEYARLNFPD